MLEERDWPGFSAVPVASAIILATLHTGMPVRQRAPEGLALSSPLHFGVLDETGVASRRVDIPRIS
jgi:hypothetical protein